MPYKVILQKNFLKESFLRVLLVTDAYYPYPSGVSELNFNRALWLEKRGIEVDILSTSYGEGDELYRAQRIGRVLKISANGSYITMTYAPDVNSQMKAFLSKNRYDAIHLSGPFPPGLSYFAMMNADKNTGIVAEFQAASDFILRNYYNEGTLWDNILSGLFKGIGGNLFNLLFGRQFRRINIKSAISKPAEVFFGIFIRGRYEHLPVGVDTERFRTEGIKSDRIAGHKHSIIYLGRMDKRKGLDRLIRTLPIVRKSIPDIKLFAGGKGPLLNEYKKLAEQLNVSDCIEFLGYIDEKDLASLYRSGAVYVSPATGGETFGIVLIEAMASGIPVIASDIPGYRDVIDRDKTGILCNTALPDEFARSIVHVINNRDEARRLADNALKKVLREYDWNVVIDKTIEQYKRAIDSARSI